MREKAKEFCFQKAIKLVRNIVAKIRAFNVKIVSDNVKDTKRKKRNPFLHVLRTNCFKLRTTRCPQKNDTLCMAFLWDTLHKNHRLHRFYFLYL